MTTKKKLGIFTDKKIKNSFLPQTEYCMEMHLGEYFSQVCQLNINFLVHHAYARKQAASRDLMILSECGHLREYFFYSTVHMSESIFLSFRSL